MLDPACGCGALLLAALDHLADGGLSPLRAARLLRGHDRDFGSVIVTRVALLLSATQLGASAAGIQRLASELPLQVTQRDVLHQLPDCAADCIVANPPYVRAARRGAESDRIRRDFATARGAFDLQVPFIELAVRTVTEGGTIGLLTSSKFLVADYGRRLRRYLHERATLRELIDLTDCRGAEAGALVNQVITIATRKPPRPGHQVAIFCPESLDDIGPRNQKAQRDLLRSRWPTLRASDDEQSLLARMLDDTVPLRELALVRGGVRGFDYNECCAHMSEATGSRDELPVVTPGNVRAFRAPTSALLRLRGTLWECPVLTDRPPAVSDELWRLFHQPKLIIKGIGPRPTAALWDHPTALMVAVWGAWGEPRVLGAALALLNSLPAAWLHYQQLYAARIPKGSLRIPLSWIQEFPVPRSGLDCLAGVAARRAAASDPAEINAAQHAVDEAAIRAYGLTEADARLMAKAPLREIQV